MERREIINLRRKNEPEIKKVFFNIRLISWAKKSPYLESFRDQGEIFLGKNNRFCSYPGACFQTPEKAETFADKYLSKSNNDKIYELAIVENIVYQEEYEQIFLEDGYYLQVLDFPIIKAVGREYLLTHLDAGILAIGKGSALVKLPKQKTFPTKDAAMKHMEMIQAREPFHGFKFRVAKT